MFSLWYLVLGVKEYRQNGTPLAPKKSAPPPPEPTKPDVIPRPSDPIPIAKPDQISRAITPEPPKPTPPKPPRPDPPKQSPPKTPEAPTSFVPKEPESPKPNPPKSVSAPETPKPSPSKPVEPQPTKISPPRTPEPPKQPPPKTPEPFQSRQPVRPNPQSREDELFAKTLNFGQKSEQNGERGGPRDLSYSSPPVSSPRYTEKAVVSNPDSLESSEAED